MDKLKEKSPIISTIICVICVISTILQNVDMFQSNGLLPDETFKKVFFILTVVLVIITIIICLIDRFCPLYIEAQMKAFQSARKSICIVMDSLNPEYKDSKLVKFDTLLENAKNNDVTVKILTRTGTERERSRGAYDICHERKLEMKFLDELNAKSLRFILIDNDEIIISCSKGISRGFSKKYAHFRNEKLHGMLMDYFNERWVREQALDFDKFLLSRLIEIGVMSGETSIKRGAEILDIPESFLIYFVSKYNADKAEDKEKDIDKGDT